MNPYRALAIGLLCLPACGVQTGGWGFEAIDHLATPPDPPGDGCGVAIPIDARLAEKASCHYGAGSHASETLGIPQETLAAIPIRHVVVMMKENRSFDHLLGRLHDRGQPGTEAIPPDFTNLDLKGNPVTFRPASTTCIPVDPGHQSLSMMSAVNGGRMDGFVINAATTTNTDGHFVMDVYDQTDLPFYYWLATHFALNDRHFASLASGTFSNRNFLMFGTHAGVVDTGIVHASPRTPSIFQLLMNAGYTWAVYTDGAPLSGTLGWDSSDPGVHPLNDFVDALAKGTLPSVAFVDGIENVEDDHPTADLQFGEAWLKSLYDQIILSPQWPRLAVLWTYDEGGAFADHVPPDPPGCRSEPTSPFTERGPRIPLVAISPWARRGYVSHVVHDHTAITRFIETIFDLPALTARDANSDALLDLFDFSCGVDRSVPPAPATGTGGCVR